MGQPHRFASRNRDVVGPFNVVVDHIDRRWSNAGRAVQIVNDRRGTAAIYIISAEPLVTCLYVRVAVERSENGGCRVGSKIAHNVDGCRNIARR